MISVFRNGEMLDQEALVPVETTRMLIDDCDYEIDITRSAFRGNTPIANFTIFYDNTQIASAGCFFSDVDPKRVEALITEADTYVDDRNELFTHDHKHKPNNKRERVRDRTGLLKSIADQFATELNVLRTPANHTKFGYKHCDVRDLSQLHVDRFGGMREGMQKPRRRISRYFINVGDTERGVCFALMPPDAVDACVPDTYSENYLNELVDHLGRKINILEYRIPRKVKNIYFYARYLSTHLLHCEYGESPDAALILCSDTEIRGEKVGTK